MRDTKSLLGYIKSNSNYKFEFYTPNPKIQPHFKALIPFLRETGYEGIIHNTQYHAWHGQKVLYWTKSNINKKFILGDHWESLTATPLDFVPGRITRDIFVNPGVLTGAGYVSSGIFILNFIRYPLNLAYMEISNKFTKEDLCTIGSSSPQNSVFVMFASCTEDSQCLSTSRQTIIYNCKDYDNFQEELVSRGNMISATCLQKTKIQPSRCLFDFTRT